MFNIILSFTILLVGGLIFGKLVEKIHFPKLIGMMIFGCLANVYLKIIDYKAMMYGETIKSIALVVVLLIAGLGIKKKQIIKVGKPAILLSVVPVLLEGITITILSIIFLNLPLIQSGMLGFIVAAVSPAVLVPAMTNLIKEGLGEKKAIPQMLLAGASADDSVAIAMFTTFISIYFKTSHNIFKNIFAIPVSIILGIVGGVLVGIFLGEISKKIKSINLKTTLVIIFAISMRFLESHYKLSFFNSLLGVMVVGYTITNYYNELGKDIINNLKNIWKVKSIFLFTLVGASINPSIIGNILYIGSVLILFSLVIRSIGVLISLVGTNLNYKERMFCVIAYLPKATVQSAKSGIPLQLGVIGGELIQAISILSVIITAPLGAIAIKVSANKLLEK